MVIDKSDKEKISETGPKGANGETVFHNYAPVIIIE